LVGVLKQTDDLRVKRLDAVFRESQAGCSLPAEDGERATVNYARRGKRRDQDRDLADRQTAHAHKARARKVAGHDRYRSILGLRERQLPQVPSMLDGLGTVIESERFGAVRAAGGHEAVEKFRQQAINMCCSI
jgi:hypothetical protein